MRKRRKGNLESLGKLLQAVYPAPDEFAVARTFAWWSRSVPPRVLEHARPVKLSHGVLIVHVSSSVWANELHYLGEDFLQRIRQHVPNSGVKKLRFKVGPLPDLPTRTREKPPAPEPVQLAALPEELGRALSQIHDDDLRQTISDAATTSLARTRHKPD